MKSHIRVILSTKTFITLLCDGKERRFTYKISGGSFNRCADRKIVEEKVTELEWADLPEVKGIANGKREWKNLWREVAKIAIREAGFWKGIEDPLDDEVEIEDITGLFPKKSKKTKVKRP